MERLELSWTYVHTLLKRTRIPIPPHARVVDRTGFEPVTSSMPWKRATNCANGPSAYYHSIKQNSCQMERGGYLPTLGK